MTKITNGPRQVTHPANVMVLTKRSRIKAIDTLHDHRLEESEKMKLRVARSRAKALLGAISILALLGIIANGGFSLDDRQKVKMMLIPSESLAVSRNLGKKATLSIELLVANRTKQEGGAIEVIKGQHVVQLKILGGTCAFPRFWLRLIGDALVRVDLFQSANNPNFWNGSFSIPMPGTFSVDARWFGCDENSKDKHWTGLSEPILIRASESRQGEGNDDRALFPDSTWISTKGKGFFDDISRRPYIWTIPEADLITNSKFIKLHDTTLVDRGTIRDPNGFYLFQDLGNYELVCFMGSETMATIRELFLEIRPSLFASQRPFKFHYYNISSFVHPDEHWTLETKQRVRKCKHILLSLDEVKEPLSQKVYQQQIEAFIGHLLKLMNDDTFPIWIFTVNEPPMRSSNCHSPYLPRTTDHPCNDVLKYIFKSQKSAFPSRVHFLDNTDLLLPQFDENRLDVLAVVAFRVFVLVGKGVAEWRAAGQRGLIDGLHRNDTVIPNFELIPYEGW